MAPNANISAPPATKSKTEPSPINPVFNSAAAPTSEYSASKSEPVEPNATISVSHYLSTYETVAPNATTSEPLLTSTARKGIGDSISNTGTMSTPTNLASNSANEGWKSYENLPSGWF